MKRLPITRVTVPVESSSRIFGIDVKIRADLQENRLISRAVFGVLTDEVAAFVPWDPFAAFLAVFLEISHFFYQFIVSVHVVLVASKAGYDNDIIMLERLGEGLFVLSDYQPHLRTNKSRFR